MKKAEREVYRALANEGDFTLCSFCKYADFSSGSCCDGEIDCLHPLHGKSWNFDCQVDNAMDSGDCWGFRPRHDVSFIADIVGIVLAEGWDGGVSWWQENGNWHVGGARVKI